jgi:hypothetical protein
METSDRNMYMQVLAQLPIPQEKVSFWRPIESMSNDLKDGRYVLLKVPTYPQFCAIDHDYNSSIATIKPTHIVLARWSTLDRHWAIMPGRSLIAPPGYDDPIAYCEVPQDE